MHGSKHFDFLRGRAKQPEMMTLDVAVAFSIAAELRMEVGGRKAIIAAENLPFPKT